MTAKEAREAAAARGFSSVAEWMRENRKAAESCRSQMTKKGQRRKYEALLKALDREYDRYYLHQ